MSDVTTLSVDCGGGGIKASVLNSAGNIISPALRTPTPYPLPPERLVETIVDLAKQLPRAQRITVGMPGMIRHGGDHDAALHHQVWPALEGTA